MSYTNRSLPPVPINARLSLMSNVRISGMNFVNFWIFINTLPFASCPPFTCHSCTIPSAPPLNNVCPFVYNTETAPACAFLVYAPSEPPPQLQMVPLLVPVKYELPTDVAQTIGSNGWPPTEPLVPLSWVPFRVQNFMCFTPAVMKFFSLLH